MPMCYPSNHPSVHSELSRIALLYKQPKTEFSAFATDANERIEGRKRRQGLWFKLEILILFLKWLMIRSGKV